jgi:hypothetical protein
MCPIYIFSDTKDRIPIMDVLIERSKDGRGSGDVDPGEEMNSVLVAVSTVLVQQICLRLSALYIQRLHVMRGTLWPATPLPVHCRIPNLPLVPARHESTHPFYPMVHPPASRHQVSCDAHAPCRELFSFYTPASTHISKPRMYEDWRKFNHGKAIPVTDRGGP